MLRASMENESDFSLVPAQAKVELYQTMELVWPDWDTGFPRKTFTIARSSAPESVTSDEQ